MHVSAKEHIDKVIQVAELGANAPVSLGHDDFIRASWERCVHEHQLDPCKLQEAVILPHTQLREHQDRLGDFLHIARHGLETLYQQVAGMGYCVLLTDSKGVTVDFLGDIQLDTSLRKAGLYLGADWSEHNAGTCGVGTCIQTGGKALTVHLDDHFDATHIPLTCTAAPVFNHLGELNAVLDISQLSSNLPKQGQHLALQLVTLYATYIENANFMHRFRNDMILKLSHAPQFLDVNPDYLLAIDALGRVIGHNRAAQILLEKEFSAPVIGVHFEKIFNAPMMDLYKYLPSKSPDQRAITLAASQQILFMAVVSVAQPIAGRSLDLKKEKKVPEKLAALSGGDSVLDREIERVARLINSPVSILLHGETGTGKEYFAKALHSSSQRSTKPFVAVNCAAIPETLIESELFGYVAGSFSGARTKGKQGLIQEADGGTLFLDEIGDMPIDLQARLLRVLSEREVLPIGATKPIPVNIRVIAASHRDLEEQVRNRAFRDDLYYRLNGAQVSLPALRNREDKDWLINKMIHEVSEKNCSAIVPEFYIPELSKEVLEWMECYKWPGNIRELKNVIEFAVSICQDGVIQLTDLPDSLLRSHERHQSDLALNFEKGIDSLDQDDKPLDHSEAALLRQYLRASNWNVSLVARKLDISRSTLYRRMEKFGIESPNSQGI